MRIVLSILFVVALLFGAGISMGERHEANLKDQFNQELKYQYDKLNKESILKCQELSATTQKEDWTYKSCLKELKLSNPEVKLL